jgi:hypothetical protein
MQIGKPWTQESTLQRLASQFKYAQKVGGMATVKKKRTTTGIKDTFQSFFLDKLFAATVKRAEQCHRRLMMLILYSKHFLKILLVQYGGSKVSFSSVI